MSGDVYHRAKEMKGLLEEVSPTFCLAKWLQGTLFLQNGTIHSCHHTKVHPIDVKKIKHNPTALFNIDRNKKLRKVMKDGGRPFDCIYCWNLENLGQLSDRCYKSSSKWAKPHFEKIKDTNCDSDVNPSSIEIAFSHICNLKCIYCTPESSSSMYEELKKYGPYPTATGYRLFSPHMPIKDGDRNPYVDAFWKWWPDLIKDLEICRITGGEPLLSKHLWKMLEYIRIHGASHLVLSVNSNMAVDWPLVEKFATKVNSLQGKVKYFTLHTSIDTIGKKAEYIRFGLVFDKFWKNINRFLQSLDEPIRLSYMITVNALSITGMKDLLELILKQKKEHKEMDIFIDSPYLRDPAFLSLKILPNSFKRYLDEVLTFMKDNQSERLGFSEAEIKKVARIKEWGFGSLQDETENRFLRSDFRKLIEEYDRRKGLKFLDVFPEYSDFWDTCIKG